VNSLGQSCGLPLWIVHLHLSPRYLPHLYRSPHLQPFLFYTQQRPTTHATRLRTLTSSRRRLSTIIILYVAQSTIVSHPTLVVVVEVRSRTCRSPQASTASHNSALRPSCLAQRGTSSTALHVLPLQVLVHPHRRARHLQIPTNTTQPPLSRCLSTGTTPQFSSASSSPPSRLWTTRLVLPSLVPPSRPTRPSNPRSRVAEEVGNKPVEAIFLGLSSAVLSDFFLRGPSRSCFLLLLQHESLAT
jgi:hypothetical protein